MARDHFIDSIWNVNEDGLAVPLEDIAVEVFESDGTTRADIFGGPTTPSVLPNPFTTDASGAIEFFADRGKYRIKLEDPTVPARIGDKEIYWNAAPAGDGEIDKPWLPTITSDMLPDDIIGLDELAAAVTEMMFSVGDIKASARASASAGWSLCDGGALNRTTTGAALFAQIGTTFGAGDGSTTFNKPDLRGRVITGVPGGSGRLPLLTAQDLDDLGESGGEESHVLTVAEIPPHNHPLDFGTTPGFNYSRVAGSTGGNPQNDNPNAIKAAGGGWWHNNMQPYQLLNYFVKL